MGEINEAVKSVAKLAADRVPVPITSEPEHFIAVPNDFKLESLARFQYADRPARKKVSVELYDVASFVRYYASFSDANSQIFADPDEKTFIAIIDYHEMGESGRPRFLEHQAGLTCNTSRQWDVWFPQNNKQMTQEEFAIFLEDHSPDIYQPDGSKYPSTGAMIDVARGLKAKKSVEFESDVNIANGQIQFKYHENIAGRIGGGEMEIPEAFWIRIPVFCNGPDHSIMARFRWRIGANKQAAFWFTLNNVKKILEDGFTETAQSIAAQTSAVLLYGAVV